MIARLLISNSLENRGEEIEKILREHDLTPNHPDLLYFPDDSKLGIAEARKIKEHFSLKPYSAKGRAVVLEDASVLTPEAQNALLKILEEPPAEALILLGAKSEANFLSTVLSRCQIVILDNTSVIPAKAGIYKDIEKLLSATTAERFEYIEKLKEREEFLLALVLYFHQHLRTHLSGVNVEFLKELMDAEKWAKQNVNIRAILEYLMLVMPSDRSSKKL